jgi:prevent-host-death family protein
MRTVNVHEAKTQFSRLIDAAHAGETILVAKDGKPWARLVPLETDQPPRHPGLLRSQLQPPPIDELLATLPPEELLAFGQVTAGQGRDPLLEESGFILGLVGQTPMLSAAAHQAGVAISQFQVGAIEHLAI